MFHLSTRHLGFPRLWTVTKLSEIANSKFQLKAKRQREKKKDQNSVCNNSYYRFLGAFDSEFFFIPKIDDKNKMQVKQNL